MKKKTENGRNKMKFTEEEMKQAVLRIVEDGVSLNCISEEVGLCKKTLKSYLDKYLSTATDKKSEFTCRPNYEINQVFTHELEKIFEEYLINFNKTVQRIDRASLRKAAFEFAMTCNVHVPKTWNIRKQAGLDWMYGFLKRHPAIKRLIIANKKLKAVKGEIVFVGLSTDSFMEETEEEIVFPENVKIVDVDLKSAGISKSTPGQESVSGAKLRCTSSCHLSDVEISPPGPDKGSDFSDSTMFKNVSDCPAVSVKTVIDEFGENLREAYCAIAQDGYVPSDRVYNLDEITLIFENPSDKIVMTACCCVSANGRALPPFMIFPRSKFTSSLLQGYAAGICGVASREGVVDDRLFLLALQHFRDITRVMRDHKMVLIVDDDDCHVTVDSIDYCQSHGIELVTLPPQRASKLQPIEQHVYRTFKSYFSNACVKFKSRNSGQRVSLYDISKLFNDIYPLAFTEERIIRGFNDTGLYPLDEQVFIEIDATSMMLTENDLPVLLEHNIELVASGIGDAESDKSEEEEDEEIDDSAIKDEGSMALVSEYERQLAEDFNETPLAEYFNGLGFGFDMLECHGGISADRVFNMDEVELAVRMNVNDDQRLRLVSCCCVNAAGKSMPPFFVFPIMDKAPESGIEGACSCTIDQFEYENDIFVAMLEHFVELVKPTPQKRVLLIADDEHCHVSVKAIDFCFKNGIILVTVPSQVRQPLQPLEKTLFERLTTNFSAECDRFMDENDECRIAITDVVAIFKNVYEETFNANTIKASFVEAGIWPLSEDKIHTSLAVQ